MEEARPKVLQVSLVQWWFQDEVLIEVRCGRKAGDR